MKSQVFMWDSNMMRGVIIASGVANVTPAVKSAELFTAGQNSLQS